MKAIRPTDSGRKNLPAATRRVTGKQPLKRRSLTAQRVISLLLAAACVVLVLVNFSGIANYINRPITEITINNSGQHMPDSRVDALLAPQLGSGFFNFDVKLAKEILEQEPWVYAARVERVWPRSLSVSLVEQVAIARWGNAGLINQYGAIFTPSERRTLAALPLLTGPLGKHDVMMGQYQRFSQILFPAGVRLTGLDLSPRGSWQLTLDDHVAVMLGRADVENKLQRFVDFYNSGSLANDTVLNTVDLRYANGIAVSTGIELNKDLAGVSRGIEVPNPAVYALSGELEL